MKNLRGEPGEFLTIQEVENILTNPVYSASDLVNLGLFHSEHYAREAMKSGKLKFQKVGIRQMMLCREDVLNYWNKYRNQPFESVDNLISFKMTISEADYIVSLIKKGHEKFKDFTKDDLFRNMIKIIRKNCTEDLLVPNP